MGDPRIQNNGLAGKAIVGGYAPPRTATGAGSPVRTQPSPAPVDSTRLGDDDDEALRLLQQWTSAPTPSADQLRTAGDKPLTATIERAPDLPNVVMMDGGEAFISTGPRTTTWKPEDGIAPQANLTAMDGSWLLNDRF
ncbi:MAG: hypothetical protein HY319_16400 [Armatimonadetes bacterium]|nr:hypothetical protein [Armatimonadota bacterium]